MQPVTSESHIGLAADQPLTRISNISARLTVMTATLFLILLAIVHVLKPEFDPSWRFISEYAIGRYGWVMILAFFCLALSCVAAFITIRKQISTRGGKIGLALLLVVAASLALAGIFVADPITASKAELTTHGKLHGLAGMIGIPGLPIAAVLITRSLTRNRQRSTATQVLRWTAHSTWITLVLLDAVMIILLSLNSGKFSPAVWIGWPNRLLVLSYCAWLMAIAWYSMRNESRA
ncbi:DUF998 domain-containing protein [bacterium]|nr:DUF998 domain-containing protein [bacterium]MCI0601935.1 DUF998 domain-containing protein [bacterium]